MLFIRASWKTRFNNAGFALLFNVRNIKKNRSVLHTPPPTLSHGVGIGRGKNDNTSTIQLGGIRDVGAPVTLCLKCQSNHRRITSMVQPWSKKWNNPQVAATSHPLNASEYTFFRHYRPKPNIKPIYNPCPTTVLPDLQDRSTAIPDDLPEPRVYALVIERGKPFCRMSD